MLTIFTMPKPFRGHIKIIQNNAIRSWLLLHAKCEIILMGDEEGTADIASELGIQHIPEIGCNEYGTPLVSSVFSIAQNVAKNQLMCYVNADIILMSDLLPAIERIHKVPFLMIGQRWDLGLNELVNFDDAQWEPKLRARVAEHGKLHPETGMDYFVFPRGLYDSVPPFALGRTSWDNWLVYRARSLRIPVIDATKAITAVHQNHDYAHHPQGKTGAFKGTEAEQNLQLLGGDEYSLCTKNATWILTPGGLRRALTAKHIYYQLNAVPALVPCLHFLEKPRRTFMAFSRIIRSMLGVAQDQD